jgi:hypothetical protein
MGGARDGGFVGGNERMKPASHITDRAKRYRANSDIEGPRVCLFCGSQKDLQVDHLDGFEENGEPENLIWLCRSCNQLKSAVYKKAGIGRRTEQYNPGVFQSLFGPLETRKMRGLARVRDRRATKRLAAAARRHGKRERREYWQGVERAHGVRGRAGTESSKHYRELDRLIKGGMSVAEARFHMGNPAPLCRYKGFTIYEVEPGLYFSTMDHDTWLKSADEAAALVDSLKNPASSYATWSHAVGVLRGELPGSPFRAARVVRSTPPARRYQYLAEMRGNPGAQTMGAFVNALQIAKGKTPGNRKAAAELISETPARRRSEFQREIWAIRKDRYGASGRHDEGVPF